VCRKGFLSPYGSYRKVCQTVALPANREFWKAHYSVESVSYRKTGKNRPDPIGAHVQLQGQLSLF
jgi:hypothetical protein